MINSRDVLEEFKAAEKEQEETLREITEEEPDFGPQLEAQDKFYLAQNMIEFWIREVKIVDGSPEYRKPLKGLPEDAIGTMWALVLEFHDDIVLPPIRNEKTVRGPLAIKTGEECNATLSRNIKREDVMEKLLELNRSGGKFNVVGPFIFTVLQYTRQGTPFLSIGIKE